MDTVENRSALEILGELNDNKKIFEYNSGMEIEVQESDLRNSMNKISVSYLSGEITLSDLHIAYGVSLYKYTIPRVINQTMEVLGEYWPEKIIPKYVNSDGIHNRVKQLCRKGVLRRFYYTLNENKIVLYSTTVEGSKILHEMLKVPTDARYEKDIIPPLEVVEKAASSLVSIELFRSPYMTKFDSMPKYRDKEGIIVFYSRISHLIENEKYETIVEPFFTRVDEKRFTADEWEKYLQRKIQALKEYMTLLMEECKNTQLILVCEDKQDFKKASAMACTCFPQSMLPNIYFTGEGALKSCQYNLKNSLIRVTETKPDKKGNMVPSSVSSQIASEFF